MPEHFLNGDTYLVLSGEYLQGLVITNYRVHNGDLQYYSNYWYKSDYTIDELIDHIIVLMDERDLSLNYVSKDEWALELLEQLGKL